MTIDAKLLQRRLGVAQDGIIGRDTWRAVFARFGADTTKARAFGIAMSVHAAAYDMMTPFRLSHFFAQIAHESGSFRYMEEIASGAAYEGRKDLGNIIAGDGKRYKGRGPLQITGRANYQRFGRLIGIDIEESPVLAANPSIGLHLALEYWRDRKLNALADRDDVVAVTKAVNGGANGLSDRMAQLARAKGLFA
ncbi:glycoside hydrolase family 19 protein [Sphingobium baderi]|uniref:Pyocin R, lytic enzyme n=1 Tax=Sphingobium baderi LL03 TaxID=1114964 RepID=T0GZH8_9SPHN|nr:glycoside hydrolase family 19 protein [Sphingobium baderi]EQB06137.1 pyocin R, lytic enzyme [Sphingobium baderi LL03]KMS62745.1 glycoside hydrolase [Sphingobium baderi LL03]